MDLALSRTACRAQPLRRLASDGRQPSRTERDWHAANASDPQRLASKRHLTLNLAPVGCDDGRD
jgi:hypothetical protein